MADTINVKLLWEDKSTGDEEEDGQVCTVHTWYRYACVGGLAVTTLDSGKLYIYLA